MSDHEGVAANELRAFIDRILRLRTEIDDLQGDVREVYAEAKGRGFDKTAMGKLVAELRASEKDDGKARELAAILDLYREAYHAEPSRGHTHTRAREAA